MDLPSQRPPSIIGAGLLSRGDLAIMYGKGGLGKSYLAMQLIIACARGEPWFGLEPPERPVRSGFVAMELTRFQIQQRFHNLLGASPISDLEDGIFPLGMDDLGIRPNLLEQQCVADIVSWIRTHRLDMVVLDAMSRFHDGDETEDAPQVMAAADRIRMQSGALVKFIHHDRKSQEGEDDLDALRGSTRFRDDPNTLIRVVRDKSGLVQLRFPKANHADEPEPIFLTKSPSGHGFVLAQSPESMGEQSRIRGEKNRETVQQVLIDNPAGLSYASIQALTNMKYDTVRRYLKALEAENVGTYHAPVWRLSLQSLSLGGCKD
jgi:hypothetical protein